MRTLLGAAVLVLLTGCTSDDQPEPTVSQPAASRAITVQRLPADLESLPRLRTELPRGIPGDVESMPRLVDDPPGRAMVVYHPPERWSDPVQGWASETLLFHGVDGRWRRLRMDELNLPDSSWGSSDTYGAGSLSPDGRWWAGQSRDGVILLDLRTGRSETVDMGSRWTAHVQWRPDSRSLLVSHGNRTMRAELLELPGQRRTALPFRPWQAEFAPDGVAYSLQAAGHRRAELVAWRGDEPVVRGEVTLPGLRQWAGERAGPVMTEGRFLFPVQRSPYRVVDLVVIDLATLESEARLHIDAQARRRYAGVEWLDPRTVLLEAGTGLLAWRPDDGTFFRVMSAPTPRNGYASLDVATDLAR